MKKFFRKITKQTNHKDLLLYAAVLLIAGIFLFVGHRVTTGGDVVFGQLAQADAKVYRARVSTILLREEKPYKMGEESFVDTDIHFYATLTSGPRKGETLIARQINNALLTVPIKEIEEGDRVMLSYAPYQGGDRIWVFQEYDRTLTIGVLLAIFLGLMLLFGGKKGIGAILSLTFTCLCIFYFFLPAILSGWNVYILTILCCVFIIAVTLILVNGFNFKSLSAAIGCVGGLVVAGVLFTISDISLKLTGLLDEESSYLVHMNLDRPIDLKAIIFASVLIGVLGAVLDVGVSIASSLNEIYGEREDFTFREVVTSGMNIGRDIISTMTNTLILAYIGGALSLTLLLMAYSNSVAELVNRETIVVEILQAILGSIGLLFTIPLTTVFYAFALTKGKRKGKMGKEIEKQDESSPDLPAKPMILESVKRLEQREAKKEESKETPKQEQTK